MGTRKGVILSADNTKGRKHGFFHTERRYPILVSFLCQTAEELVDEVLDLFDRCMAQVDVRARRDLEEFRRNAARAINEKLILFKDMTGMILDPQIADPDVRAQIYQRHPKESLQAAIEESERLLRPADDTYFDFLTSRYSYGRQFAPLLLSAFTFRANRRGERAEDLPGRISILQQAIQESLPLVELPELLAEVDSWTHFSRQFESISGNEPRTQAWLVHLYAAILAQACNLGMTAMARLADLSYEQLEWYTNWYLREETLRPATTTLVNYQHRLPLSRHFGSGTLSSSDGQRFPVAV